MDQGAMSRAQVRSCEALFPRLPSLLHDSEPPSPLHGDLWGGNAMATTEGPAIFDPAVYAGHREVDLAMMHLFGGFSEACFAAYNEITPLAPGHEQRRPLYQLYPLLVHVLLFGGHYATQVLAIATRFG